MSGADPRPGGLACISCARDFGSAVAFCPFCGTSQRRAAAPVPPVPLLPVPPSVSEPVPAPPSPWTVPPPPIPRQPAMRQPIVPPSPPPAMKLPPAPRRWLSLIVFAVLGIGALFAVLRPLPTGTVTVGVRGTGGPVTEGHVLIDGIRAGAPGQPLTVSAGTHQVSFEEPGYTAEPVTITVVNGTAATATLTARDRPARLSVTTTPPGAAIRVMNRSWGISPATQELSPGSYDVVVSLPGHVAKTVSVRLERGEARVLAIDLAAIPAPAPRFGPAPFPRGVLLQGGALVTEPNVGADIVDTLPPFSEVQVLGQVVTDETWLQLRAGGRQGFVRLGAVENWDGWAQRNTVSGTIDGMTLTMRLVVGARPFTLFGVQAPDHGNLGLSRIQASLANLLRGQQARCVPMDPLRFQCKTAEGRDIAEMYVLNGAAVTGDGALPYYVEAQRSARERQKGVWSE